MSNHEDYKSEIDQWAELWDNMQKEGVHPDPEKLQPSDNEITDLYYHALDAETQITEDPQLIQEKTTPCRVDHTIEDNPIHPDSVGPDYKTTPPVWLDENGLKKIEDLRNKMFELENQVAEKMGGGKKWSEKAFEPEDKKLMSEIESLRKKLDDVSSKFGLNKGLADEGED